MGQKIVIWWIQYKRPKKSKDNHQMEDYNRLLG